MSLVCILACDQDVCVKYVPTLWIGTVHDRFLSLLRSVLLLFIFNAVWHQSVSGDLVFRLFRRCSSVIGRFSFVRTLVLQIVCMRQFVFSGLGALKSLVVVGSVCLDRAAVASFVISLRYCGSQSWNARHASWKCCWSGSRSCVGFFRVVPCLGLCDGCVCSLMQVHPDLFLQ